MNFRTIFIANPKTGKVFTVKILRVSGSIESMSPKTDFTLKPLSYLIENIPVLLYQVDLSLFSDCVSIVV